MCRAAPDPRWMSGAQLRYPIAMIVDIAPRRSPSRSNSSSASSNSSRGLVGDRRDRQLRQDVVDRLAGRDAPHDRDVLAGVHDRSTNHARTRPSRITPSSRSAAASARVVPELPRELGGASERLLGAVEVRPRAPAGCTPSPTAFRSRSWPSSMQAASSVARVAARRPRARGPRARGSAARSSSSAVRRAAARRRRTSSSSVGVAERLRRARRARRGPPSGRAGAGACRGRGRAPRGARPGPAASAADGQRDLDDAQDLLGRVRGERVPARLEREPHADLGVAGGLRVLREQRQARGRGFAREQELDDRRVDRAPARCRAGRPPRTRGPARAGSCSRRRSSRRAPSSRPAATAGASDAARSSAARRRARRRGARPRAGPSG